MIVGEIRRFLRDDGMLKVSRSIKESQYRIWQIREELISQLSREPTIEELAARTEIPVEELLMILEAGSEVESLHKVIYQSDGTEISLMDRIPEKENNEDKILNRIFLEELLERLDAKERKLIYMRYFRDMTQNEIAENLGISQVQVSRMEKRILAKLRK